MRWISAPENSAEPLRNAHGISDENDYPLRRVGHMTHDVTGACAAVAESGTRVVSDGSRTGHSSTSSGVQCATRATGITPCAWDIGNMGIDRRGMHTLSIA